MFFFTGVSKFSMGPVNGEGKYILDNLKYCLLKQYCGHKNADNVGIYIRTFREFLSYLLSTINQEHSQSNPKFRINFPPNLTNSPPKFQMYQIPQNTKILKIPLTKSIFMIPTCRCQCSGSSG